MTSDIRILQDWRVVVADCLIDYEPFDGKTPSIDSATRNALYGALDAFYEEQAYRERVSFGTEIDVLNVPDGKARVVISELMR